MKPMKLSVLTGCQMEGLVSALQILFPTCHVEGFHNYRLLGNDRAEIRERLREADLIFALPLDSKFEDLSYQQIRRLGPQVQFVPHVVFAAFHPDITYVERADGSRLQTPMTDYNSIIALSAYLLGLDADRTLRLFNAYTYQALGHFDLLEGSARSLLADFMLQGIDLQTHLARWLQDSKAFMYSTNHPRAFVLADVALEASRAAGLPVGQSFESDRMPDRLAEWVVYPVYKEIGARLGKTGSYQFKTLESGDNGDLSLPDFIQRSFAQYEEEDAAQWILSKRVHLTKATIGRLLSKPASTTQPKETARPADHAAIYAVSQHVTSAEDCYFYHTMDLPGLGTQPGPWDLRGRFSDYIGGIDLTGQRVLDVGAASGFLTFSAEEAGAKEVVSFDLDTADRQHLLPFADSEYVTDHASWSTKQTATFQRWKNAYWFTHRLKRSKAKVVYGDVYALPEALGQFDVIILGAILEHLGDPIRALASVAKHARKYIVINTDYIEGDFPIARFNGRPDRPDSSFVFWTYSIETYRQITGILGYEIVSVRKTPFTAFGPNGAWVDIDRAVLVCRKKQPASSVVKLQSAA